jgi:hypothetical protein
MLLGFYCLVNTDDGAHNDNKPGRVLHGPGYKY